MKKLIFSLSLLLSFSTLLHAQWTTSGTVTSTTNSIGIGTTSPASPLDIQVNTNLTTGINLTNSSAGSAARTRLTFFNDANYALINLNSTTYTTDPNSLVIYAPLTGGGSLIFGTAANERMRIANNGNIGIGTTNPATLLHIATTAGPVLTLDKTGVQAWRLDASQGSDFRLWNTSVGTAPLTVQAATGNVGIGTIAPDEKLVVNGNIKAVLSTYLPAKNIAMIKQLDFSGPTGAMNWTLRGVYQYPNGVLGNADGGDLDVIKSWNGNTILGTKTDGTPLGNIGIGIINPQNKLDVNGTIHSKAVNIDLNGWNDYVFKKDYQLRPLSEVKAYIDQNQHLPEIPSEQEMVKKGLDVGEMNKLLMKKVEELTLYLIEKDQQVKEQNKRIDDQQKQINKLIEAGHK